MPTISSLVLTNQSPTITYTASLVSSASVVANGLGNQITFLDVTSSFSNTSSYSITSSLSIISYFDYSGSYASSSTWATSASFASKSISSSYAPTVTVGLTSTQSWVDMGTLLTQSMYLSSGLVVSWSYKP